MIATQVEETEPSVKADSDTVKAEDASKEDGNAKQEDAEMKDAPKSTEDDSGPDPAKAAGVKQEAEKQDEGERQEGKKEGSKETKEKLPEKPMLQLHGKLWPSGKLLTRHPVGSHTSCYQLNLVLLFPVEPGTTSCLLTEQSVQALTKPSVILASCIKLWCVQSRRPA